MAERVSTKCGISSPPPSTRESMQRESPATPIVVGTSPTTRRPSPGSRRMSRNAAAPASPVPYRRTRSFRCSAAFVLAAVKREESALEPQHTEAQERQDRPDDRHESGTTWPSPTTPAITMTVKAAAPAKSSRRASCTLACCHICP